MTFSKERWRESALEKLQTISRWLNRRQQQDLPYLTYGTVAGLTIWPLVEVAVQTGQLWPAVGALYGVVSGVGANLIAEQLQRWHDKAEGVTETDVVEWIATQTAVNDDLQETLDTILEQFQAIPQAQTALSDEDRAWFAQTLQTELAQLGSLPRFQTTFIVYGDFVLGDKHPTQDSAAILLSYRRTLAQRSRYLPLQGVDPTASDAIQGGKPLGLAHVYVALDTKTQRPRPKQHRREREREEVEYEPLPALTAVAQNRKLVLLGDPGSGKSTFVTHLAHCLAAHALQPEGDWLAYLPHWPQAEADIVPVVVILRDFAYSLPEPLPAQDDSLHLWHFIASRLQAQNLGAVADILPQLLEEGRVLLLLDGLDEVASSAKRRFVRDAVQAFSQRYPDNRTLVTCRVLSYQPPANRQTPDLRLPAADFPIVELAPFDEEKIDHFIGAWYKELVQQGHIRPQDGDILAPRLQTAVRQPDLWRLASNPLLLTVMALVHTHERRLPDARALLYEKTIDMLLWRWDAGKVRDAEETPALRQLLLEADCADMDLKRLLWRLAYQAHADIETGEPIGEDDLADIDELRLRKALAHLNGGDWGWADQMLAAMKLRAGLLLERAPGFFTFPHRTFQEYLAGAYLSSQGDFDIEAAKLGGQGALWREVIVLAVGRLVHLSGDTAKPLALVQRLCPVKGLTKGRATATAWRQVWLAGDVLRECGLKRVQADEWGQELYQRVQGRLVRLLEQGALSPRERAEAGRTLSKLGDPRAGVCTLEPEMVAIDAGTFLMGEEKHSITLEAFAIARYPITNAQYRFFIEDGGYSEKWRDCWTEDGWHYRDNYDLTEPSLWQNEAYNQDNQPVVGVMWYEAVAYANWLSRQTGQPYRLPTEAEWERAARATDGRLYPWGDVWQAEAANAKETGIGRPTAVGLFPAGATVEGVLDMSGNVREWCQTRWQDEKRKQYPQPYRHDDGRELLAGGSNVYRVRRGGSYGSDRKWMRCAARGGGYPNDLHRDYGFRVVRSLFFADDR